MSELKRTQLYDVHVAAGASMAVSYTHLRAHETLPQRVCPEKRDN